MRGVLLVLLGLIGLAAGADKVRKLAGINGYISDHPDERCDKIGEFLLHPYNRCSYLVCDYGHEPWKDDYGRTKYYARIMPCAPGTAVPKSAYRHGAHKLNPSKVCTEHYSGHCPAPVSGYGGNFYGGAHYTPRHKPRYDDHDDHSYSFSHDHYKPSQGYGLKGGYSYEERYPRQHSHSYVKTSYGKHDDRYGKHDRHHAHGRPSHKPSYGPSHSHGSSYGSHSRGSSYGGRPSSSYGRPSSSHGRYRSRGSSRGRYSGGRRPSHHGSSSRGRHSHHISRPSLHSRPSFKPRHDSYKPSYHKSLSHGHKDKNSYGSYGYNHSPGLSFKEAPKDEQKYDPEPATDKESSYSRKSSYSPSNYRRDSYSKKPTYGQSSYSKGSSSYPRSSTVYGKAPSYRKDPYPSKLSGYEKDSYSRKSSGYGKGYQPRKSSGYKKDSYPKKPSYVAPSYAKAPRGVDYPSAPKGISYPSVPRDVDYPSAPRNVKYPSSPQYSSSGYNHLNKGGHPHRGPAPTHNPPRQFRPQQGNGYQGGPRRPAQRPFQRGHQQRQPYNQGPTNQGPGNQRRPRPYPTGQPSSQQGRYPQQQY